MSPAQIILVLLYFYAAVGAGFATGFVLRGAATIDPVARGAPIGFRLLVWPGALALWPFLLMMWVRAARTLDAEGPTSHSKEPAP